MPIPLSAISGGSTCSAPDAGVDIQTVGRSEVDSSAIGSIGVFELGRGNRRVEAGNVETEAGGRVSQSGSGVGVFLTEKGGAALPLGAVAGTAAGLGRSTLEGTSDGGEEARDDSSSGRRRICA